MKKILLTVIILFSFQSIIAQKITFGVKGGVNLANYVGKGNFSTDFNYKFGYQIGGLVRIKLSKKIVLQPELLYSLQGSKFDALLLRFFNAPNTANISVNDLNIVFPVLIKFYIIDDFAIGLGPELNYMFKTTFVANGQKDGVRNKGNFNLGLNAGLMYDFSKKAGVEFRYNYGFNKLSPDPMLKINNSMFSLNFEYRFN